MNLNAFKCLLESIVSKIHLEFCQLQIHFHFFRQNDITGLSWKENVMAMRRSCRYGLMRVNDGFFGCFFMMVWWQLMMVNDGQCIDCKESHSWWQEYHTAGTMFWPWHVWRCGVILAQDVLSLLVRFTQGMDGLLGVAGMIITSDYGSFPKIPC